MTTQTNPRMNEIKAIWQQYQGLYVVGGILIGILIFPFLELVITDLSELLIGLVPEAIGIGFTVFFLDRIYQKRDIENLKKRLIREVGSRINDVSLKAIEDLRSQKWLIGDASLLKGADLRHANLANADLKHTNLEGTDFFDANLKDADLQNASLFRANLRGVKLSGAKFGTTNPLVHYVVDEFDWMRSVTSSLYLTILPDGTKWTPETDMTRFTNPEHPDFWQPYDID